MAGKYDDLLESFMNNSAKAYNEDKEIQETQENNKPAAYAESEKTSKQHVKRTRGKTKSEDDKKKNKKKKSKRRGSLPLPLRFLLGFVLVVAVVCIVCFSVIAIYGYSYVHGDAVFDLTEEKYSQNQTSFIYGYDSDGNVVEITRLHGEENRIWVDLDDMSPYLQYAFIAIEDQRFESHHGVDWIRTIGVIVKPSNSGQGGSTITQQLIKNLTDENDVTIVRKFKEILSALNLERYYSKDEIIEAYLNTIYLSEGCYGVKTAAETYFGKDVSDLNIAECAALAAITQYPSKYNPLNNPDSNRTRQLYILEQMLSQGYITQEEYDEAVAYEMVFTNSENYGGSQVSDSDSDTTNENVIDSYYVDYVIKTVLEDLQKMGYTERKARSLLYGGGLKIYTAIDFEVQEALEDVYENYVNMPDETVQGAMVVMDYAGRVLGMVGGTGEYSGSLGLNRAFQSYRQPGSAIKPLSVYAPAFELSLQDDSVDIYWSTLISDSPLMEVDGDQWPTNEGGTYSGSYVTIQQGIARSLNTVSARVLDTIGVDYSYDYITNYFHISSLTATDCDYAPLATGSLTNGVSVLEMTAAYATFGNGGVYYQPYCYYKIEDSQGNVLIETDPNSTKEQALSESTSWLMNKLLQTVMTSGTGRYYKISGVECFGKTGTTTDSKDRWFVGGTPEYVAAVWYGYDTPKEIVYSLSYNPAGTIWNSVMERIYDAKGINETEFEDCDDIVQRSYDSSNGLLASYSSGNYGWYDVNNLPGYSTRSSSSTSESTSSSDESESTTESSTESDDSDDTEAEEEEE